MAQKPVLTLDTLTAPTRPVIEIDEVKYELALQEDFSLREQSKYGHSAKRIDNLLNKGGMSDVDVDELNKVLDAFVSRIVLKLPPDVLGALKDHHKVALIQAFTQETENRRSSLQKEKAPEAPAEETRETAPVAQT